MLVSAFLKRLKSEALVTLRWFQVFRTHKLLWLVSAVFLLVATGISVGLVRFNYDGSLNARVYERKSYTLTDRARLPDQSKAVAIAYVPVTPRGNAGTSGGTGKQTIQPGDVKQARTPRATRPQIVQKPFEAPVSPHIEHSNAGLPASKSEMPAVAAVGTRMAAGEALRQYVPPRPVNTVMPNMALFEHFVIWRIKEIQIEVDVDTSGRVTAARVLNPDENLSAPVTAALIAAAKGWTFEPATIGGQNIPAKHTIVFHFPRS